MSNFNYLSHTATSQKKIKDRSAGKRSGLMQYQKKSITPKKSALKVLHEPKAHEINKKYYRENSYIAMH